MLFPRSMLASEQVMVDMDSKLTLEGDDREGKGGPKVEGDAR